MGNRILTQDVPKTACNRKNIQRLAPLCLEIATKCREEEKSMMKYKEILYKLSVIYPVDEKAR
jgi:hypothetical protein